MLELYFIVLSPIGIGGYKEVVSLGLHSCEGRNLLELGNNFDEIPAFAGMKFKK